MRSVLHICDGDLEDRTMYLCDIVHNLGCVVHHIYDVIYKIRVVVLNEAGVLTGDDNVEVCLFFDLVDDAKCEIIFYDTPENYLAVVDTDRAVLSYVGDLIFNGIKHTAFVVVHWRPLAATKRIPFCVSSCISCMARGVSSCAPFWSSVPSRSLAISLIIGKPPLNSAYEFFLVNGIRVKADPHLV